MRPNKHAHSSDQASSDDFESFGKKLLRARSTERAKFREVFSILDGIHNDAGPSADRALVIQGTAMIEHALEVCIKARFDKKIDQKTILPRIFGHREHGPLCTLGARALLAHALGEIGPQTLEDLNTIGEIRNAFAHSEMPIDFNFPPVVTLCDSIRIWEAVGEKYRSSDPRGVFRQAVAQVVASLTIRIRSLGQSRNLVFTRSLP